MVRGLTVLVLATLVLTVTAGWSQTATTGNNAVVVGQNAQGQNLVVRVIPLKFLDASVVAQLFGGMTLAGGNLGLTGAQGTDQQSGYTHRSRNPYNRNNNNNGNNSYSNQGTGYQSSYGQRY